MAQNKSTNLKMDKLAVHLQNANDSGYFSPSFASQLTDSGSSSSNVDEIDREKAVRFSINHSRKKFDSESSPSRVFVREDYKTSSETNECVAQTDRIRTTRRTNRIVNDRIVTPHLIGCYVSKEHVDFVKEFVTLDLDHILAKIFVELTSSELNSVFRVSRTWRESCRRDSDANTRWREFLCAASSEKENGSIGRQKVSYEARKDQCFLKESTPNIDCTNEDLATPTKNREITMFSRFMDEARKLKADEQLDKCPRCLCPARVTKKFKRAVCSLYGCSFEYCIECRCAYSPEHKCDPLSPTFKEQSPKASRTNVQTAKKSLRRLLN